MSSNVKEKSVLYSCKNANKPSVASTGNLVLTKAVIIMINKGMEASRVKNPDNIRILQNISNAPVR